MSRTTYLKTFMAATLAVSLVTAAPGVALAKKKDETACQAEKKKSQTNGMLLGAAAGAVGGNVVSGKKSKGLGTVAGAVVGGVVGAKLGKDKVKCPHPDDHGH